MSLTEWVGVLVYQKTKMRMIVMTLKVWLYPIKDNVKL